MTCMGVVRGKVVEPEGELALPEGTRVRNIPEPRLTPAGPRSELSLAEWLQAAREGRSRRPTTTSSTDLLREMREERAGR
jgi:hypothetical protein